EIERLGGRQQGDHAGCASECRRARQKWRARSSWERTPPAYSAGLIVTHTSTGVMNFPGAGLPISIRSAVTNSPVARLKLAQGFGIRPKVIFWIGRPVAVFMIVARMLIPGGYGQEHDTVQHRRRTINSPVRSGRPA